jgi:hypothetical protein
MERRNGGIDGARASGPKRPYESPKVIRLGDGLEAHGHCTTSGSHATGWCDKSGNTPETGCYSSGNSASYCGIGSAAASCAVGEGAG